MPTSPPHPGSGEQPLLAASRRTIVGLAVGLPISVVLMVLAVRNLDAHALARSLRSADPKALVLALAAMAVVYVAQALRWKLISGASLPLTKFVAWVVAAVATNNVLPGRAGDVLRIEWLSRGARVTRTRSTASVVVDRGCDVLVLASLLAVTYPFMQHTPWLRRLGLGGFALGLIVAAFFVGAFFWARRSERALGGKVRAFADDVLRSVGAGLRPRRALAIVGLSAVAWVAWAVSAWLVAHALGIEIGWSDAIFVTAVINLGVAIPSSPGFVGTYQWLAVSALGLVGVAHVPAFAFSVLMHALWFVPTTLAGAAVAARKARLVVAPALPRRTSESHAS